MAIVIAPAMTDRMKPMPPTDMLPTLSLSLSQYHFERLSDLPRHLPGLLDCPARELHHHLTGPTLLHLPGRRQPELFVSVLLHGNEDVGWVAVQQLLREALAHRQDRLPRALTVLIGNVQAARQGLRRLDGQPDHNRVWPGAVEYLGSPEQLLMAEVHRLQCERGLFAAIDIHNNSGLNPHYGIVCRSTPAHLHLAGCSPAPWCCSAACRARRRRPSRRCARPWRWNAASPAWPPTRRRRRGSWPRRCTCPSSRTTAGRRATWTCTTRWRG